MQHSNWYQNEKKNITELGHNGRLKIYVNPSKFSLTLACKSIQSPFKWLILLNHYIYES